MSNKQTFKPALDEYLKKRQELSSEIKRLKNGDSSGMILMSERADGKIIPEAQRVTNLLHDKIYQLGDLESRIEEFCLNLGLEIPPKLSV